MNRWRRSCTCRAMASPMLAPLPPDFRLERAVVLREPLVEPDRDRSHGRAHEQVTVFVEHDRRVVGEALGRERDRVGVDVALEVSAERRRLAVAHRQERLERLPRPEHVDHGRRGRRRLSVGREAAEDGAKLLELERDVAERVGGLIAHHRHRLAVDDRPTRLGAGASRHGERAQQRENEAAKRHHSGTMSTARVPKRSS